MLLRWDPADVRLVRAVACVRDGGGGEPQCAGGDRAGVSPNVHGGQGWGEL